MNLARNPTENSVNIFWGEIAPCEHLVQIYDDEASFLDALEGFIGGGLRAGEGVIIIATRIHREALDQRLRARGFDIARAKAEDRYVSLDAEETVSRFLVNGSPDEELFDELVTHLIARARGPGRQVRAFGEMVAVMWGRGHHGATVRLEHLWQELCQRHAFSLFCAYPRSGFTQDASHSIQEICAAHSRLIAG